MSFKEYQVGVGNSQICFLTQTGNVEDRFQIRQKVIYHLNLLLLLQFMEISLREIPYILIFLQYEFWNN